jgi:hypothetical protein
LPAIADFGEGLMDWLISAVGTKEAKLLRIVPNAGKSQGR